MLLEDHGELDAAETMTLRAIELEPDYADHYSLLAVVRLKQGDPEAALDAVRRGRARVGERTVYHALTADAYRNMGRFRQAADAQRRLIRAPGREVRWQDWVRLARFESAAGDTAAALAALDSAGASPDADRARLDSLRHSIGSK